MKKLKKEVYLSNRAHNNLEGRALRKQTLLYGDAKKQWVKIANYHDLVARMQSEKNIKLNKAQKEALFKMASPYLK